MKDWPQAIKDAALSGVLAGATTALTAAVSGKAEGRSALAPVNAISHILWGDKAAAKEAPSVKYTLTGLALNSAAGVFWASMFEKLFGRIAERRGVTDALLGGAAIAALAYVTDYYLVPRRFTPGFEKRLSNPSLATVYGVLALSVAAGALLRRR